MAGMAWSRAWSRVSFGISAMTGRPVSTSTRSRRRSRSSQASTRNAVAVPITRPAAPPMASRSFFDTGGAVLRSVSSNVGGVVCALLTRPRAFWFCAWR